MKMRLIRIAFVVTVLLVLLCETRSASAQWTAGDAQRAYAAYNNAFLKTEPDGYSKYFATVQGGTTPEDFWRFAEEIDMADDAYFENKTTANQTEVQALCDGFIYLHGDTWTSDTYNDDINVAVMAFARAYQVTGTARWLNDAKSNFTAVWNRAQAGDGGLCENTGGGKGCYENSSANWTFVINGRILYTLTGDATDYKNPADSVYSWALSNLYIPSSGGIADGKGGAASYYSYNYGYAIGAMNEEGASASTVGGVADFLFNNFNNYAGTSNGYNILPNYGQGNLNNSGFNGIACRWLGIANGHGLIPSADMSALAANTNQLWTERNGTTELIWNDWVAATPSTGTYSWDDSASLACLLDSPPTS